MVYNAFNQLSKVTQKDQTGAVALIAEYTYRPDGLRHSKSVTKNGVTLTHTHIWDGANIVAEIGATGTIVARYLRGLSLIAREQDGACQYYFHNAHGDVVQRIDALGNLLKNYDYDAFGNEQNPVESDSNPFRYCGEYWDKETETIYLRNRSYSPTSGRFTSEDPIRAGDHWYNYCAGNPISLIDPSGLSSLKLINQCYYDKDGNWRHDNWEYSGGTVPSDTKSYVFYDPNVVAEKPGQGEFTAELIKEELSAIYPDQEVILRPISSKEDFVNAWNSMGDNTNQVIIHAHGVFDRVGFADENGYFLDEYQFFTIDDLAELEERNVEDLIFLSCDVGSSEYPNTLATEIMKTQSLVKNLIAADGATHVGGYSKVAIGLSPKNAKSFMLYSRDDKGHLKSPVAFSTPGHIYEGYHSFIEDIKKAKNKK